MTRRVGERRRSREYALQLLFQMDLAPDDTDIVLQRFWDDKKVSPAIREFAEQIVKGTVEHRDAIDEVISSSALNWRISRMAVVDRNILRMSVYEFIFHAEIPRIVIIDEGIEIAKKFGNDESGPFVNGILDAIRTRLEGGTLRLPPELEGAGRPTSLC